MTITNIPCVSRPNVEAQPLTAEQLSSYCSALQSPGARKAAERALAAIRTFARAQSAGDLLRGAAVHGADLEAWLSSIEQEAIQNLATAKAYRARFEDALSGRRAALSLQDAAAMELIARRQESAAMKDSKSKAIRVDVGELRAKLIAAGMTPEERDAHINQRYADGGFEAIEAGLLCERDTLLAEAAALQRYLSDPERCADVLPEPVRAELLELAAAMPLRAQTTHPPVNAHRVW